MINTESLIRLHQIGKPIVWTLHDEWAYTGGCHYTYGCEKYSKTCSGCPQINNDLSWLPKLSMQSRRKLREIPITFICPSNWIQQNLKKSIVFNQEIHSSYVVPNSIDLNTFNPYEENDKIVLRERMNIPQDSLCLVAGSFSHNEERKGGSILLNGLRKLNDILKNHGSESKVVLLTYGKGEMNVNFMETINLGFTKKEDDIAKFLNTGDLFLSMSREDNLPNTILESLACGIPVFASNIGGIPDMVEDGFNGKLVTRDDCDELASLLCDVIKDKNILKQWSKNARNKALMNFSHDKQASAYIEIFEQLIKRQSVSKNTDKSSSIMQNVKPLNRIPAINSFPSEHDQNKANNWYKSEILPLYYFKEKIQNVKSQYCIFGDGSTATKILDSLKKCNLRLPICFITKAPRKPKIRNIPILDAFLALQKHKFEFIVLGSPIYQDSMKNTVVEVMPRYSNNCVDLFSDKMIKTSEKHKFHKKLEKDLHPFIKEYKPLISLL